MGRPALTPDDFWGRVEKRGPGDCWLWCGDLIWSGYGHFQMASKQWSAHRLAWTLANGPIPASMFVLHRCDDRYPVGDRTYRRCCNPSHLYLGTHRDNMEDMKAKGRQAHGERLSAERYPQRYRRGEANSSAVMTVDGVRSMRALYAQGGYSLYQLAEQFGISQATSYRIINRLSWQHVE